MIKKQDAILAACLVLVSVIIFLIIHFTMEDGERVVVYQDSEEMTSYDLNSDGEYEINTDAGTNVLVIEDGKAYIKEADCPDGLCIKMGKISKSGENIVCLPHKLVIQIEGGEEVELDAVS